MYFIIAFIHNLKYTLWVSETQFYIRTAQNIPNSALSTSDMYFNFTDLTPSDSGEFDICWGKCFGYDGKVHNVYEGLQFWFDGQRLVSADHLTTYLDIPTKFLDVFVGQVRIVRPDLTISPDVLSRLSPPALPNE
ncbi:MULTISPECIES: hypothetical protein [unclassified Serratia (in: enterobacteria)]|uniref:hypothetical protein n=1 Tax=unclassified Serratia (in: enterobacteria) TaxID=2647522 RepID=UPI0030760956